MTVDDRNPTARALRCLELISDHPGITADRLAERLGVTERAARRYVSVLREADVPVVSTRGPHGGYRLGRGRRTPLIFTTDEALALVMAVLDGHHAAADDTEPVGRALGKLLRALPESVGEQAAAVRRLAAAAPDRQAARPDPAMVSTVATALNSGRRVRLGYRSEAGNAFEVEADPWALVIWHGRWYLLCSLCRGGENPQRCYRVDRITALETLAERAVVPADLDPVRTLEANLATGWEYPVEVLIDAGADAVRRWLPRSLGRLEEAGEGRCRLLASTGNPWFYAEELVRLPVDFHVVQPVELISTVRVLGERLLRAAGPIPASVQQ
ncbi:helix-turn-helix transcriptional regulator [Micropruina sonneratiae]|uniref:helix-turn-helix transcriptional regulator n=1 Tax=Micropruina sonneratiae TaxID=2986940 RepID=UPI00222679A5|nr:WYL domain-containing protein [Micropruina sp. KQZ13P-5]MCW3156437.1 WYL domain-containing protein [Micropruina sp. KQZ13P-5]